ncbi:hypothetical protein VPH35_088607 [Triticum aestivum]
MLRVTTPTSKSASVKLCRSHSSSFKATRQGSRGTKTPTVRSRLPSRGLGLPSGTSKPSSTSPSINIVSRRVVAVRDGELLPPHRQTASYCRRIVSRTVRGRHQGPATAVGADMRAISINASYVAKQQHAPVDPISLWAWHTSFFLR